MPLIIIFRSHSRDTLPISQCFAHCGHWCFISCRRMLSFYCGYAGGSGKVRSCVRGENAFTHICIAEGLGKKLGESHSTCKERENLFVSPSFMACLRDGKHSSRLCVLIIYRLPFFIFLLKYKFLRESRKIFSGNSCFPSAG